jgi:creatinine amidohydrolase
MKNYKLSWGFLSMLLVWTLAPLLGQEKKTTIGREMMDINWMHFREMVPAKIDTVLLPTGTYEAHGVINNGADIMAPTAIARKIAEETNSLIAPAVPYGITGSLDAYPGSFSVGESAYREYMKDVLSGMAKMGFRNIIVINGHGGPQSTVLSQVATEIGQTRKVRTLVINWWIYTSDVTQAVFGEDGGHAGWNENAMIQAIDPQLVHRELYKDSLAIPLPATGSFSAYPSPASILLYKEGQGYVRFDQNKAEEYFLRVNRKIADLIIQIRNQWNAAGL